MKAGRDDRTTDTGNRSSAGTGERAWKKALSALGGPFWRLHQYRDIRTKALHDAIFVSDRRRCDMNPADCEAGRH